MAKSKVKAGTARYGSVEPFEQEGWNGLEATVFAQEDIAFMTLGEIRKRFNVYVEKVFRGLSYMGGEERLSDALMIVPGMTLSIWGDWKSMKAYCTAKIDEKQRVSWITPVYCSSMPKKSRQIKDLLRDLKIHPAEAHSLENYRENSPEDVGFYFCGAFYDFARIRDEEADIKKMLKSQVLGL